MNVTVIIPIHQYDENVSNLLNKAITSIANQKENNIPKTIIVYKSSIENDIINNPSIKILSSDNLQLLKNDGNCDYQSQVNYAVEHVTTDYFSVLEFDDEYSSTYFYNVNKYIMTYPNVDVFMPIIIEVNKNNEGIKLTNEIVWSQHFVGENGEMGYLNQKLLKEYTDFKLSGAVIKKSEFINIGKYKTNIKLTFMLEFLLRALNNTCKIYTIPKIGYKHLAMRDGSLFSDYLKNMPMNERKFWFDIAYKEYNFNNERFIDISNLNH